MARKEYCLSLPLCLFLMGCNLPLLGSDLHTPQAALSGVKSHFLLTYRHYYSRKPVPKKFEDLTPTNWFHTIERQSDRNDPQDYSLRIAHHALSEDSRMYLDFNKTPSSQEGDVFARFVFYFDDDELKEDNILECKFGYRAGDSDCQVSGSVTPQENSKDLSFFPGLFPKAPLKCSVHIYKNTADKPGTAVGRTHLVTLPNGSASIDAAFSFSFDCYDTKNKVTAVQGLFFQNDDSTPSLRPKSNSIEW